jgi:hypothetical protein
MASSTLKNWVKVNPTTGASGSTSVAISADAYYGRVARNAVTLKVDAAELTGHSSADTTFTVAQAGRGNYIVLNANSTGADTTGSTSATVAVTKTGNSSFVISGRSNCQTLYFYFSGDTGYLNELDGYLGSAGQPFIYINNSSTSIQAGTAISGDPGATGLYTWKTEPISVVANNTIETKTIKVQVASADDGHGGASGTIATLTITIAEGDPYVTLSTNAITIPYAGTAQTLTVSSNTNWSITE